MKTKLAIASIATLAVSGVSLVAASPKWNSGPTLSLSGGTLFLDGKATGLGNAGGFVDFTVEGTVTVSSRCYTRKGNTPQAANKQEEIAVDATFSTPINNGQTTLNGVIVATAESTLSCPGGQRVVIEDISVNLTLVAASPFAALTAALTL